MLFRIMTIMDHTYLGSPFLTSEILTWPRISWSKTLTALWTGKIQRILRDNTMDNKLMESLNNIRKPTNQN